MKNIHVLPTDKPSELYINMQGVLSKSNSLLLRLKSRNIYITSDEEIKEGDWFLENSAKLLKWKMTYSFPSEMNDVCKKIILTTDQDLIKDGVQAIDDDFLEWYVKNPSCEEVKVGEIYPSNCCINKEGKTKMNNDCMERNRCLHYKIIIPSKDDLKIGDNTNFGIITDINEKSVCFGKNKVGVDVWYKKSYVVKFPNLVLEEPKQETLTNDTDSHSWGFENFEIIKTEEDAKIFVETMENIPEPNNKLKKAFRDFNKQETLEEVALNYAKQPLLVTTKDGFIAGAKWQQEQDKKMYSEEEVFNLLMEFSSRDINSSSGTPHSIAKWFEQFKNK